MDDEENRIVQLENKLAARYQYLHDLQNGNQAKNSSLGDSIRLRRESRLLISKALEMRSAAKDSCEMSQDSVCRSILRINSSRLRLV